VCCVIGVFNCFGLDLFDGGEKSKFECEWARRFRGVGLKESYISTQRYIIPPWGFRPNKHNNKKFKHFHERHKRLFHIEFLCQVCVLLLSKRWFWVSLNTASGDGPASTWKQRLLGEFNDVPPFLTPEQGTQMARRFRRLLREKLFPWRLACLSCIGSCHNGLGSTHASIYDSVCRKEGVETPMDIYDGEYKEEHKEYKEYSEDDGDEEEKKFEVVGEETSGGDEEQEQNGRIPDKRTLSKYCDIANMFSLVASKAGGDGRRESHDYWQPQSLTVIDRSQLWGGAPIVKPLFDDYKTRYEPWEETNTMGITYWAKHCCVVCDEDHYDEASIMETKEQDYDSVDATCGVTMMCKHNEPGAECQRCPLTSAHTWKLGYYHNETNAKWVFLGPEQLYVPSRWLKPVDRKAILVGNNIETGFLVVDRVLGSARFDCDAQ